MEGKCNSQDIVYEGEVKDSRDDKVYHYIDMTSEEFRKRYSKHKQSFMKTNYKNETTLSKKVWELKEESSQCPVVKFKILKHSRSYRAGDKMCLLCTDEKYEILNSERENLLNNRKEIFASCRHRARFKIEKVSLRESQT